MVDRSDNPGMQFCNDHTNLVQAVGRIEGRQELQLTILNGINEKLIAMATAEAQVKTDLAIQKVKIKPIFWLLGVIGIAIVTFLSDFVWIKFFGIRR